MTESKGSLPLDPPSGSSAGGGSEQHHRLLADMLPSQVWTARPDGTLDYVNQRVLEYFDRPVDRMLADGWRDFVHPEDLAACVARWSHSLRMGEPYSVEFRLRRADGSYRWHQGVARPVRDAQGRIVQWLGTNNDVDDAYQARQRLEDGAEALRASERRLRLALEAGQLGTWEWDIPRGTVHWSETLELMHGIPVGAFPGTFDAYQSDIHPEDRERVLGTIRENVATGRDHSLTYRIVRPDGGVRWLEAHGRFDLDEQGIPRRLIGVCGDVTDRVQAEAARTALASESYAALRAEIGAALAGAREIPAILQRCCEAIVAHLPTSIARVWLLDPTNEWLDLRASAGKQPDPDGEESRVPMGRSGIGLIAAGRKPYSTNVVIDDDRVPQKQWALREGLIAFVGFPLLAGDALVGVLAGFATKQPPDDLMIALGGVSDAIAHGVARRRAEIELDERARDLARSNAELEQFAYVASHDLQEPLRTVASYNQLLARRYKGRLDQDADEFIAFTVDAVARMQRLINDLLAYSRVGTRGRRFGPVSTERALALAIDNLRQAVREADARVTHGPLPEVVGDEGQLTQLFQNLIGNSLKFRGPGAVVIHVSARPEGRGWLFSVRDNGVGIDAQYFDRIFVIFQRLHSMEEYPGTGIGLALCKKIVERHGGRIWLESKVGEGSTFFFVLPGKGEGA